MSETAKAQKQQELAQRMAALQKDAAESQFALQNKERELTKPLIDQLRAIIETISKEKKLQLVLEKNEGAVLYSEGATDLTQDVITRFNKNKKK